METTDDIRKNIKKLLTMPNNKSKLKVIYLKRWFP